MISLIISENNEIYSFQYILAHNFHKTIGDAANTELDRDVDRAHNPNNFHKDP